MTIQDQTSQYFTLMSQGVPQQQAFMQAFPNGLPSRQDILKQQGSAQQKQGYGTVAGMAAGALGSKGIYDAVTGKGWFASTPTTTTTTGSQLTSALNGGGELSSAATTPINLSPGVDPTTGYSLGGATDSAAASSAPGAFDLSGIGSAGNAFLPAIGAYGLYDMFSNHRTGGTGIGEGAASGAAMGSYFGPEGAIIGGLLGAGLGAFNHKSTKQYEKEKWGAVSDEPGAQNAYLANHPYGDTGVWSTGKYAGQKWSFAKANDLAKTGTDFNEVLGNYQVDKNWGNYTTAQKQAITNQAAQLGLYQGKHGDVVVNDPDKFLAIRDQVLGNQSPTPQPVAQPRLGSILSQVLNKK